MFWTKSQATRPIKATRKTNSMSCAWRPAGNAAGAFGRSPGRPRVSPPSLQGLRKILRGLPRELRNAAGRLEVSQSVMVGRVRVNRSSFRPASSRTLGPGVMVARRPLAYWMRQKPFWVHRKVTFSRTVLVLVPVTRNTGTCSPRVPAENRHGLPGSAGHCFGRSQAGTLDEAHGAFRVPGENCGTP